MLRSELIPPYGNPPVINYSPHAWHIFPEMSRTTEITNSRTAVMWQKHVIRNNRPLCFVHFKLLPRPAVAVRWRLATPYLTICYDLPKVYFNSADCLNTYILLLSQIKDGYWFLYPKPISQKKVKNSKIAYKYIQNSVGSGNSDHWHISYFFQNISTTEK